MSRVVSVLAVLSLATPATATDYWVSAIRGNDNNAGTIQAPFKTITKATGIAGMNDTIRVLPGRYSPALGETFPITVPAGCDLIGQDPRTCVIDAEFDPNAVSNPVTGNIVRVLQQSRFAYMRVINGARNPQDPGKEWWKIALWVEGQGGNSADVEIDHVIIDEVSRAIVCGFASGDHDMKNIKIHDCVIQRFYVEAINSWINNGTAQGNLIWNCTVAGHMRTTAPIKPFPRAGLSFGNGAQFDIRNCVIVQTDWAGIEAGSTTAKITSDHNCLHGGAYTGFVAHRGLTAGTNDLLVDPKLADLPAVTALIDPHQTSTTSPIWRKGINQPGQDKQLDIDFRGPRLIAGTVDIGADEFNGHDAYFVGMPKIGTTVRIGFVGSASNATILALGFRSLGQGVKVPGFTGELWLDPSLPIVFAVGTKDARGYGTSALPIPNDAGLRGLELDLQGIDLPVREFSDLDQVFVVG